MYLLATMCADLLHYGHVRFLKKAKDLAGERGLLLLVGVHSDEVVCTYKRLPILNIEERAVVVSAIRYVDKVLVDAPLIITKEYMEENKIDLVVHAHEESDTSYDDDHAYPISVGKFVRLDYTHEICTTDIINRCRRHSAGRSTCP